MEKWIYNCKFIVSKHGMIIFSLKYENMYSQYFTFDFVSNSYPWQGTIQKSFAKPHAYCWTMWRKNKFTENSNRKLKHEQTTGQSTHKILKRVFMLCAFLVINILL